MPTPFREQVQRRLQEQQGISKTILNSMEWRSQQISATVNVADVPAEITCSTEPLTAEPEILPSTGTNIIYVTNKTNIFVGIEDDAWVLQPFGSNNPTITLHREANYDFIIPAGIARYGFTIRTADGNTVNNIPGLIGNNLIDGVPNNVTSCESVYTLYFTPTIATPSTLVYQAARQPEIKGTINII